MEGREREGPNLLLNQGPSDPCYATECALNSGFFQSNPSGIVVTTSDLVLLQTGVDRNRTYHGVCEETNTGKQWLKWFCEAAGLI